ncbi:ABC transporter ATP-binding protein [Fimbriimonas ginsengisoli]|uniref:ABC transporter-related protein n=1 Tax=Fimbriimonas ginsengisoli Gsoil 348 TaxID=661478 RepID=A0A068NPR0_FIMGI|nr:ABC transporter ATP-binding protein [Fimbriimonas ginsengisoli]AIE85533.1 ABC transporter-related protein [Fimbriimonas ginsengisoli Gsoil 348]
MSELLGLEHFAIRPDGPTLTLSVSAGQSMAVVGPAGAGKSQLLRTLAGRERPAQGTIQLRAKVAIAGETSYSRRAKVQSLARRPGVSMQEATEILSATRLWDVRHLSMGDLSPSQLAATELVEALLTEAPIAMIDGQLDGLDPWALPAVLEMLRGQRAKGRTLIVATHRPDLIREQDALIVLYDGQVRFAGSIDDLLRAGPPHSLEVGTENQPGVRSLVAPFRVSIRPSESGMRLEAPEGQELAARLLLEGYGDVKFVIVRPPTIEEALRAVV